MLSTQQYLELIRDRGKRRLEISRVYRNIQKEEWFLAAYVKIQSNKGALTPGVDPKDTVDGMSLKRIRQTLVEIENGTYRPKPVRRVYIPKANGKSRPLGILTHTDKMIQEVVRTVLEAYYEPQFSDHSHGFRPGRGCHTALNEIKGTWTGTKWFIEGDIKGCFDNIDHDILINILERNIKDNRLLNLIWHMLRAGYMEQWKYNNTYSGTPQGGIISPLLANVYLNELDKYIETELLPRYNKGKARMNPEPRKLRLKAEKAWKQGDIAMAKAYTKARLQMPVRAPMDSEYRRLRYVRYADDFILGFVGPKEEAEEIKQEIGKFLRERLKLELAKDKTLITHATSTPARFLGYNIFVGHNNTYMHKGNRTINGKIQLRVPADVLHKCLRWYMKNGLPHQRADLLPYTDYSITMHYESELRGITNYYSLASNVGNFYRLKHVMMESLVMTLANKHKARKSTIYRKYATVFDTGMKGLKVEIIREGKPTLTAKFGSQPIRYSRVAENLKDERWRPYSMGTQLSDRLMADECELCGSNQDVQIHHIRKLEDIRRKYRRGEKPKWVAKMIDIRRKTLVVCYECHQSITHGTYDGQATSSRRAG